MQVVLLLLLLRLGGRAVAGGEAAPAVSVWGQDGGEGAAMVVIMARHLFPLLSFSVPRGEELPGGELAVAVIDVGRLGADEGTSAAGAHSQRLSSVLCLRVVVEERRGGEDWGMGEMSPCGGSFGAVASAGREGPW